MGFGKQKMRLQNLLGQTFRERSACTSGKTTHFLNAFAREARQQSTPCSSLIRLHERQDNNSYYVCTSDKIYRKCHICTSDKKIYHNLFSLFALTLRQRRKWGEHRTGGTKYGRISRCVDIRSYGWRPYETSIYGVGDTSNLFNKMAKLNPKRYIGYRKRGTSQEVCTAIKSRSTSTKSKNRGLYKRIFS